MVTSSPPTRAALVLLTPLVVLAAAVLPGGRWWLPLLAPVPLLPAFLTLVRARAWGRAWSTSMLWAALLSASIVVLVVLAPTRAADVVLNGEPYREMMFGYVFQGVGPELEPRRFLPEHALHLGVFLVLSLLSAGVLALVLGALLVGYMSYFVGAYGVASGSVVAGSLLAWVPWSVCRVAAFVLIGCLLARPLLVRRFDFAAREWWLLALAALGIALDLTLKTLVAAPYGRFLASFAAA